MTLSEMHEKLAELRDLSYNLGMSDDGYTNEMRQVHERIMQLHGKIRIAEMLERENVPHTIQE